jgi:hypothetical protein
VPVFDHETVAATLGFVGTTAGIPADPGSGLVAALQEAAARLSRELGYAGGTENEERASKRAHTAQTFTKSAGCCTTCAIRRIAKPFAPIPRPIAGATQSVNPGCAF